MGQVTELMTEALFESFYKRGIVREKETKVRATFRTNGVSGNMDSVDEFTVIRVFKTTTDKFGLELSRNSNGRKHNAHLSAIRRIDGMSPIDLADAFELNPDGTPSVYHFDDPTNADKDIIGQENYTLPSGDVLQNGMRIFFEDDKNPDLNDIPFTVRGVGEKIELKKPRGRPKIHFN